MSKGSKSKGNHRGKCKFDCKELTRNAIRWGEVGKYRTPRKRLYCMDIAPLNACKVKTKEWVGGRGG